MAGIRTVDFEELSRQLGKRLGDLWAAGVLGAVL